MVKNDHVTVETEFKRLRRKLLDLTMRNQLLNFKSRTRTLDVINNLPVVVYQTLVLEKHKMQFAPTKKESAEKKSFIEKLWRAPELDLSFGEDNRNLHTELSPTELQKRLFYISQQSKTMLEEQGYNILYLALGFLEWKDKKKPNEIKKAPLVLIPVELKRKEVGKSYTIRWNGEDLQTNISLQAKLKDEGILLPEFHITNESGFLKYFDDVEKAVRRMHNWNINKEISLGFFSFTKFVMYRDLDPNEWDVGTDLTQKPLIKAIFHPENNKNEILINEQDIDQDIQYQNMYHVLDADSSQIAVIENVKAGHNLVVEGPPGTGKSQTIVNLIAELLAEGKSVLFVSEKMAALEVVKNRLDDVGLGKFALELHSHKTRKKKLLKELESCLHLEKPKIKDTEPILRRLESLKMYLDEYSQLLHTKSYSIQLSPFELYGLKENAIEYFANKEQTMPLVRFKNPEKISKKEIEDTIITLENLAELYNSVPKHNNPWTNCNPGSLLPSDLREIDILITDTLNALSDFKDTSHNIYEQFGIPEVKKLSDLENTLAALTLLDKIPLVDSNILKNKVWFENSDAALKLIEKLKKYQVKSKIFTKFNDNIFTENIPLLIKSYKETSNTKLKIFSGKYKGIKEEISQLYNNSRLPNDRQVIKDLEDVYECIGIRDSLIKQEELGAVFFGDLWHLNADISDLEAVYNWMKEYRKYIKRGIFSKQTIEYLSNDLFTFNEDYLKKDFENIGNTFSNNLNKLKLKLNARSKILFKQKSADVSLDKWEKQLQDWKGQLSLLHLWSQYLDTKHVADNGYSKLFIKTIEKKSIEKEDVKALVEGNFADSLLSIIFSENQKLAGFIGELHENRIKEFCELDNKIIKLNRERIINKLNKNIPQVFGATGDREATVLAGEFTRKSGHLPVRKLMENAGGIIKQIKPCFMMSPLSVAQYLDPTNPKLIFDVVIFDEASQVKPEDALGAFMRAETAVVMGDTQQLPPTVFFDQMTTIETEEEVATATDMESILHLCKLSFNVKMLKWHYRSRHESLINVSNEEFYDNQLLVYPSPAHNTDELGLKLIYNPEARYDRGKSASNKIEAENVVKEIFNHLEKYGDTKSLGVGTFSVAQRNMILEQLELERNKHPDLEYLFSDKKHERFFVKNLETIQGDERDVILISIGYGFDLEGKMSLNFGPLNQDGGERRLNVLITRAREKCVIFSNFKAHDMHLTSNPPFGVKALRNFLEYAEQTTLGQASSEEDISSEFEDSVHSFLRSEGYSVDKYVGCAGFRMDLAIIDENNPGRYILGIECDGDSYHASKVARDRDRLRDQVLNGLGWDIYHLWSTDWYRNPDFAKTKLIETIEEKKASSLIESVPNNNDNDDGSVGELETVIDEPNIDDDNFDEPSISESSIDYSENDDIFKEETNTNDTSKDTSSIDYNENDEETNFEDEFIKELENTKDNNSKDDLKIVKSEESNVKNNPINKIRENKSDKTVESQESNMVNKENKVSLDKEKDIEEFFDKNDYLHPKDDIFYSQDDDYELEDIFEEEPTPSSDDTPVEETQKEEEKVSQIIVPEHEDNTEEYVEETEIKDNEELLENLVKPSKVKPKQVPEKKLTLKEKIKIVKEELSEFKDDVKFINESLQAIEEFTDKEDLLDHSYYVSLEEFLDDEETIFDSASRVDDDVVVISPNEESKNVNIPTNEESKRVNISTNEESFRDHDLIEMILEIEEELKSSASKPKKRIPKSPARKPLSKEELDKIMSSSVFREQFKEELGIKDSSDKAPVKGTHEFEKEIIPLSGKTFENYIVDYSSFRDIPIKNIDDLYGSSVDEVTYIVLNIIKMESPIHKKELINRIKDSCSLKRASAKFKKIIENSIENAKSKYDIIEIDEFLICTSVEVPIRRREHPNIDLISDMEIEKAISCIVKLESPIKEQNLIKDIARGFGFKATGAKTSNRIKLVISFMISNDKLAKNDTGRILVKG